MSHSESVAVAITGSGLACALGVGKQRIWSALSEGRCGIGPLTAFEQQSHPMPCGGQVPSDQWSPSTRESREVTLLRLALDEALVEARRPDGPGYEPSRCGIVLGTTLGGMRAAGKFLRNDQVAALRDFLASAVLQQMAGDRPFTGPAITTCAACASGLSAVALGVTLLQSGACDMVIAGGYDPISEYAWAGFNSLRLIAAGPPRPFSAARDGMQLGEGYAIMILERADDASKRGAQPRAIIAGCGESSDAHHLTQPQPDGHGAARAMTNALRDAGITAEDVDLIAAHATATPNNDAAEHAAYRQVFAERLAHVPIVAFKSHVGHTLGGAGAVELVLSLMAMEHCAVPPTATVRPDELEFNDLRVVTQPVESARLNHVMNLSLGFGGANACAILRRADAPRPAGVIHSRTTPREVAITGVGVILPGAIGNGPFLERLKDGNDKIVSGTIDENDYASFFNARRARRMCELVKLMLAASSAALEGARISDVAAFAAECGAILGSMHGAAGYSYSYYQQVVREGLAAANPMLFAEGVPNVASAQLSLMLGLKGGAQTIIGSRTAGLDALRLAVMRIQSGAIDRMIVGAAEEHLALIEQAHHQCGGLQDHHGAPITGSGAVAFVLERADIARARAAPLRALVGPGHAARTTSSTALALMDAAAQLVQANSPARIVGCASSAPATAIEDAVMHRLRTPADLRWTPMRGRCAEIFSVNPLAAMAAMILAGPAALRVSPDSRADGCDATVLAIDPIGLVATASMTLPSAVTPPGAGARPR
jgi:3-oxoacyl-[acyl-carrier-protein] synthase II